jgi:hypothetical protein
VRDIEELLRKNKEVYDELEAPEEMEGRLKNALENKKMRTPQWKRLAVAAILVIAFIFTYNYNAIAYYGKRLLGYDSVMSQSLQDLNELGKGQEIGKSFNFNNGVKITLDGIMVDDNQLLAFYRIKDPNAKNDDTFFSIAPLSIRGLFREYNPNSGQGEFNEATKELVMIHSFEPPSFYERKLKFQGHFEINEEYKEFSIGFTLDRNKAMGHSIKQKLNKSITLENQEIRFKDILATSTQTVISGSLASLGDLAMEKLKGEQVRPIIDCTLIVDRQVYESVSTGVRTNLRGITFEHIFEPLPENIEDLKLAIINLTIDKKIKKVIPIEKGKTKGVEIEGQWVKILKVNQTDNTTEITIESNEDVLFPDIQLIADGQEVFLENTHDEEYEKTKDGIIKRRIISFKTIGEELELKINKIHYKKEMNKVIDIPIK